MQFLGPAFFGDLAARKHHNMVRRLHGAHPVGDDQHGLARQQAGQRALHLGLVLHVKRGRGLIQQHDRRVFQKSAGNGDALSLAAGELGTVFADRREVALGQLRHKLVAVGRAGGREDFLIRTTSWNTME